MVSKPSLPDVSSLGKAYLNLGKRIVNAAEGSGRFVQEMTQFLRTNRREAAFALSLAAVPFLGAAAVANEAVDGQAPSSSYREMAQARGTGIVDDCWQVMAQTDRVPNVVCERPESEYLAAGTFRASCADVIRGMAEENRMAKSFEASGTCNLEE